MRRQCIKVPRKKGEPARRILLGLEILDNSLKIGSVETLLYLPLSREPDTGKLEGLPEGSELTFFDF